MNDSLLKTLGVIALIVIGVFLLFHVGLPVAGLLLDIMWGIAGFFSFLLQIVLFLILLAAVCSGIIMVISWLIQEFTE